jgi:hypothetical protein
MYLQLALRMVLHSIYFSNRKRSEARGQDWLIPVVRTPTDEQ